jgi:transcriptional regulator with XRE-family HTH domain
MNTLCRPDELFGAEFGGVVHRVRVGRGMTMDDLAAATGMSKASISTIENGLTDPRLSTVLRLADALRLPWWSLLGHACDYPGRSHA